MPFFNSNNVDNNFFSAYTTISSASTFQGTVDCFGNGKTRWEFSDGFAETSATTHYNIPGSGLRLVKASVNRNNNIKNYDIRNMNLSGSVRVFEFMSPTIQQTEASTIELRNNSALNSIILPDNSNRFIKLYSAANCSLSGRLDLTKFNFSGFPGDSLTLYVPDNSAISSIVLKDADYNLATANMDMYGCSLGTPASSSSANTIEFGTTIDLRPFKALGGSINLTGGMSGHGNSGITYVLFPSNPSGNTINSLVLNGLPNYTGSSYNLDLSWAREKLGGSCVFNNLPLITGITSFSSVTNTLSQLDLSFCDLQGQLDLTPYQHITTYQYYNNNSGLTSILFNSATGNTVSQFYASYTNLKHLDLSMYLRVPDYIFNVSYCSNLTGITMPNTLSFSAGMYLCYMNDCNFTSVNFSGTNLAHPYGTRLSLSNNLNLTGFTFPQEYVYSGIGLYDLISFNNCSLKYFGIENLSGYNNNYGTWSLQNNNMTAAVVNETLVKFDNTGWTGVGCSLSIEGTNAAPDTTSGGFNGVAAKISLTGKGWTVTTS